MRAHICSICVRVSAHLPFVLGAMASFIALPARKTINMQRLSNPFSFCDSASTPQESHGNAPRCSALPTLEGASGISATHGRRTRALGRDRRGLSVLLCRISTLRTAHGRHGRTGRATSKSRATDASHRRSVRRTARFAPRARARPGPPHSFSSVSAALCRKH